MAREYPRFLYSHPTNTKSKGPFVLHTLEPKFLCRITPAGGLMLNTSVQILEMYSGTEEDPSLPRILSDIADKYDNKHFQ